MNRNKSQFMTIVYQLFFFLFEEIPFHTHQPNPCWSEAFQVAGKRAHMFAFWIEEEFHLFLFYNCQSTDKKEKRKKKKNPSQFSHKATRKKDKCEADIWGNSMSCLQRFRGRGPFSVKIASGKMSTDHFVCIRFSISFIGSPSLLSHLPGL